MRIIVNTESLMPSIPDGTYEAEFIGAESGEMDTKFGRRTFTTLKFKILSKPFDNNIVQKKFFWPVVNGKPVVTKGCGLGKAIFEITGRYELTDQDVGNKVFIKIQNQEKGDNVYSNIVNIMQHPENIKNKLNLKEPPQSIKNNPSDIKSIKSDTSLDDLEI